MNNGRKTLNEAIERMKYLSEYGELQDDVDEGLGKNLAAGAMMTAASMFPMKSAANSFDRDRDPVKTELSAENTISNENLPKLLKGYEKNGYKTFDNASIFISSNKQNKQINKVDGVGTTQTAANLSVMQKAGNPNNKLRIYKVLPNKSIEIIMFYVK